MIELNGYRQENYQLRNMAEKMERDMAEQCQKIRQ